LDGLFDFGAKHGRGSAPNAQPFLLDRMTGRPLAR